MVIGKVLAFGKSEKSEFINIGILLPHREGIKGGAISGGLRQIGRDHVCAFPILFISVFESTAYLKFAKLQYASSSFR